MCKICTSYTFLHLSHWPLNHFEGHSSTEGWWNFAIFGVPNRISENLHERRHILLVVSSFEFRRLWNFLLCHHLNPEKYGKEHLNSIGKFNFWCIYRVYFELPRIKIPCCYKNWKEFQHQTWTRIGLQINKFITLVGFWYINHNRIVLCMI